MTTKVKIALAICLLPLILAGVGIASGHQSYLNRDNVFYQIENDNGDHGNFWETYQLPVKYDYNKPVKGSRTATVFCVIYSDKIGSGGGAAGNCDFEGFYRAHPHAFNVRSAG